MQLEVLPQSRWAGWLAEAWGELTASAASLRTCLPTGTTPAPLYDEVAARVARGEMSLAGCEVFLLDEYGGLPAGHPVRCDATLQRQLVDRVDLDPTRFHTIDVDAADLEAECRRYDGLIASEGLDLTLLGLGVNGHVGMNEPGSLPSSPTRVVELAPETREAARRYAADVEVEWGVTVGMDRILESRRVWLLVRGARKAGILRRTLQGPVGPECPASFLREHPEALVVADEEAAALLG